MDTVRSYFGDYLRITDANKNFMTLAAGQPLITSLTDLTLRDIHADDVSSNTLISNDIWLGGK